MATNTSYSRPLRSLGRDLKHAKWTVIVLIAAESDLGEDFKDIYDQIATIGSNETEVNFVVIFDGLNSSAKKGDNGKVTVYYVRRNNFYNDVTDNNRYEKRFNKDNLAKPENLKRVLTWTKKYFPADLYGFIYMGHGGQNPDINNSSIFKRRAFRKLIKRGTETEDQTVARAKRSLPKGGSWTFIGLVAQHDATVRGRRLQTSSNRSETVLMALFSNNTKGFRVLQYSEMAQVLKEVFNDKVGSTKQLGFVCLDTCWGQMIEHGMAFKDVTQFLVASADEMALLGIGYEGFCTFLVDRPDVKPGELADLIVSEYFQTEYNDYLSSSDFSHMGVSLTCIETTYMDTIINLMCQLSEQLEEKMETHFYLIHVARLQCMAYTYEVEDDEFNMYNIDLIWFLENLQFYNRLENGQAIDGALDNLISNLLTQLSLYYIKSFLASNYNVRKPGENASHDNSKKMRGKNGKPKHVTGTNEFSEAIVGGKGVGIFFPTKASNFDQSFYGNRASTKRLPKNWKWGNFLKKYVEHKEKIMNKDDDTLQQELAIFKKGSRYRQYLGYCNECVSSYSSNGHSLEEMLAIAKKAVELNIPHKWVCLKQK